MHLPLEHMTVAELRSLCQIDPREEHFVALGKKVLENMEFDDNHVQKVKKAVDSAYSEIDDAVDRLQDALRELEKVPE